MGVRVAPGPDQGGEHGFGDEFGIWDVNWPSLSAFLDLASQWRWALGFGAAARLGLDWSAADLLLRRRGLGDGHFEDLIAMETAALEEFARGDRR